VICFEWLPASPLSLSARIGFTFAVLVFIAAAHAQSESRVPFAVIADPKPHVPAATVTLTSQ